MIYNTLIYLVILYVFDFIHILVKLSQQFIAVGGQLATGLALLDIVRVGHKRAANAEQIGTLGR